MSGYRCGKKMGGTGPPSLVRTLVRHAGEDQNGFQVGRGVIFR